MIYLIIIAILFLLLGGFLVLTAFEAKAEARLFKRARTYLDAKAARAAFIIKHVDWSAFLKHSFRATLETIAHEVAHATLLVVRFLERSLTRAVRVLRERGAHAGSGERSSFVDTVRKFRKSVNRPRKSNDE